jgi:glyoxylase-like metal-dependent hydrolase (beta-lactamase superfamily II)
MKITSEIFEVGGGRLTSSEDAAIYLIKFGPEAALVDAGCGHATGRLFENIAKCGVDPQEIKYLLITHCHYDHTGGAAAVKKRTGAEIIAHRLDAAFLESGDNTVTAAGWYGEEITPFKVDRKLAGSSEEITLGGRKIEAIHIPGHSPGSVVFLTESDGLKVLFAQDVHGPLDSSFLSNPADYQKSLKTLLDIGADILCEGHFGVYRSKTEAARFIRQFMKRY